MLQEKTSEELFREIANWDVFRRLRWAVENLPPDEKEEVVSLILALIRTVVLSQTEARRQIAALNEIFEKHNLDTRILNRVSAAIFG